MKLILSRKIVHAKTNRIEETLDKFVSFSLIIFLFFSFVIGAHVLAVKIDAHVLLLYHNYRPISDIDVKTSYETQT